MTATFRFLPRAATALFTLLLAFALLPGPVPAADPAGAPTQAGLLAAWEKAMKDDPASKIFQKTADRTYRFQTDRFPFDGELRVLNLVIDDRGLAAEEGMPGMILGVVETELVDAPADFQEKHAMAWSIWNAGNTLFWHQASGRWLTSREYSAAASREYRNRQPWYSFLLENVWLLVLLAFLIFMALLATKTRRQMKTAMSYQAWAQKAMERSLELSERSVATAEDSNRVLKEILAALPSRKPEL